MVNDKTPPVNIAILPQNYPIVERKKKKGKKLTNKPGANKLDTPNKGMEILSEITDDILIKSPGMRIEPNFMNLDEKLDKDLQLDGRITHSSLPLSSNLATTVKNSVLNDDV